MKPNENAFDREIRIVLALILGILIITKAVTGSVAIIVGILAAIAAITGLVGFCAIYAILGISSCPVTNKKK
jgi:hypothetical protein